MLIPSSCGWPAVAHRCGDSPYLVSEFSEPSTWCSQSEQHAERGHIAGPKQAAPELCLPGAQRRAASQNSSSQGRPMTARQVL